METSDFPDLLEMMRLHGLVAVTQGKYRSPPGTQPAIVLTKTRREQLTDTIGSMLYSKEMSVNLIRKEVLKQDCFYFGTDEDISTEFIKAFLGEMVESGKLTKLPKKGYSWKMETESEGDAEEENQGGSSRGSAETANTALSTPDTVTPQKKGSAKEGAPKGVKKGTPTKKSSPAHTPSTTTLSKETKKHPDETASLVLTSPTAAPPKEARGNSVEEPSPVPDTSNAPAGTSHRSDISHGHPSEAGNPRRSDISRRRSSRAGSPRPNGISRRRPSSNSQGNDQLHGGRTRRLLGT
jgi:hypothetical protein